MDLCTSRTTLRTLNVNINAPAIILKPAAPLQHDSPTRRMREQLANLDHSSKLSPVRPMTGAQLIERMEQLSALSPCSAMSTVDILVATNESAINELVTTATAQYAGDKLANERIQAEHMRLQKRLELGGTALSPFWAEVCGHLRLVRVAFSTKSAECGRLELGTYVRVVDTRQTSDGAWRAAVALSADDESALGWMTLITKDGIDNLRAAS